MDFSDRPIDAPVGFTPIDCEWHTKFPLLAVSGSEPSGRLKNDTVGSMHVFEDGQMVAAASVQRVSDPSHIVWHPHQRILAAAWLNGEVLLWNHSTQQVMQCQSLHTDKINFVQWSPDGSTLLTGDAKGHIGVWKLTKSGKLSLSQQHRRGTEVVRCAFQNKCSKDGGFDEGSMPALSGAATFFVATSAHEILLGGGTSSDLESINNVESKVEIMMFDAARNTLVVLSKDLMLFQVTLDANGRAINKSEVRIAGRELTGCVWVGPSVLAVGTNQNAIRLFDLEENELSMIQLKRSGANIISVAADLSSGLLTAVASDGSVILWQHQGEKVSDLQMHEQWDQLPALACESAGTLKKISVGGPKGRSIAIAGDAGISTLERMQLCSAFGGGTSAVQTSSTRIVLESDNKPVNLETDLKISGITANGRRIAIWSGRQVGVYELTQRVARSEGLFKSETDCAAIYGDDTVYVSAGNSVQGLSYGGVEKQSLRFGDGEAGNVTSLDVNDKFLVASTSNCYLSVWDVSKREAKLVATPRHFKDLVDSIVSAKINVTGTHVSFLAQTNDERDSSVWVWDTANNSHHTYDFSLQGRVPLSHFWDPTEPQLLAIEAEAKGSGGESEGHMLSNEVLTMFATAEEGLLVQHKIALSPADGQLMGVQIPFLLYVSRKVSTNGEAAKAVERRVIPSFEGLETANAEIKSAMIAFSYNLTLNNMDEAFKAVRRIKNDKVWESMARMCVATKRMDVAKVCIGSMGNAVGARALREAMEEGEEEVQAACLAIQLGMKDEAESLLKSCGRYDLLNKYYQNCGRWPEALETARLHDRVHLRTTQYNHAKFLEVSGKIKEAIRAYESSETHHFEVPRMLGDDPESLEEYIKTSQSKELLKWWAQYLESSQDMSGALEYYAAAGDSLSQTRVHCYCGDMARAKAIVDDTKNAAAAYHLARQYENQEQIDEAIQYYSKAGTYNSAIRIAKENDRKEELLGLALRSTKSDMIEAAQFYESQGSIDRAVTLYHKGGRVARALELCFEHKLFQNLADISEDLDQSADPELLRRAASFFIDSARYDKAVNLLVAAQQFDEAVEMCKTQAVIISDEMAEKMTVEKSDDNTYRNQLLEQIADVCLAQGSYQLATRKYTQAGNKMKAMKALLKCGDTEKIVFFAQRCRQKEIYILAANHLQTLDWRNDTDILNNIVAFYTKGKALDFLSRFYERCAQNEIDDYQSYDKAVHALREAHKYLTKSKMKDFDEQEQRVHALTTKISLIERFLSIKQLADTNPEEMLQQAHALLKEPEVEAALQIGDVYGTMIEYLASAEQWPQAYETIQTMEQRIPNVGINYYVRMTTIEEIHKQLGIPLGSSGGGSGSGSGGGGGGGHSASQDDDDDDGDEVIDEVVE